MEFHISFLEEHYLRAQTSIWIWTHMFGDQVNFHSFYDSPDVQCQRSTRHWNFFETWAVKRLGKNYVKAVMLQLRFSLVEHIIALSLSYVIGEMKCIVTFAQDLLSLVLIIKRQGCVKMIFSKESSTGQSQSQPNFLVHNACDHLFTS